MLAAAAFAGDIASFQNLGFSEDGRYFVFGLYGATEGSLKLYAELYAVDVRANRFVQDGTRTAVYDEELEPGNNGIGALFTLFRASEDLIRRYNINHMRTGRLLYILVNGDEPKSHLEFRDFATGRRYEIDLIQSRTGTDKSVSSSFHINLTVKEQSGSEKYYTIGLPNYRRTGVRQYKIRRILLSPEGDALVFVVEKEEAFETGANVRYMVETVYIG
jgi:predicted secreted protein